MRPDLERISIAAYLKGWNKLMHKNRNLYVAIETTDSICNSDSDKDLFMLCVACDFLPASRASSE
jgi:hypothetical protein